MNEQYIIPTYNMSAMLAEDAGAPELRNPNSYSQPAGESIIRFLKTLFFREKR